MSTPLFKLCSPQTEEQFARYFRFRWQQLRQPLNFPLGSEQDSLESQAYHCMAETEEHGIIAVGRIHLDSLITAQIRFMAVDAIYQRQQIGSRLLADLLAYAQSTGVQTCWLNARASAYKFYQAQGFILQGEVDSPLDIPHLRMQKSV